MFTSNHAGAVCGATYPAPTAAGWVSRSVIVTACTGGFGLPSFAAKLTVLVLRVKSPAGGGGGGLLPPPPPPPPPQATSASARIVSRTAKPCRACNMGDRSLAKFLLF